MTLVYPLGFIAPVPFWLAHKKWPNAGWDMVFTPVIIYFIGYLCVGINSSVMNFFLIGLFSQAYVRRKWPNKFVKYNYLVSAALDGGTSVIIFILSFAIFGAAGNTIYFPNYWGNNEFGNYDRCAYVNG